MVVDQIVDTSWKELNGDFSVASVNGSKCECLLGESMLGYSVECGGEDGLLLRCKWWGCRMMLRKVTPAG